MPISRHEREAKASAAVWPELRKREDQRASPFACDEKSLYPQRRQRGYLSDLPHSTIIEHMFDTGEQVWDTTTSTRT